MPKKRTLSAVYDRTDIHNALIGNAYLRNRGRTRFWTQAELGDAYQDDNRFRQAVIAAMLDFNCRRQPDQQIIRPRIEDYIRETQNV